MIVYALGAALVVWLIVLLLRLLGSPIRDLNRWDPPS